MGFKEHPEWSKQYPAIDGVKISREEYNIRSDVATKILTQSRGDFYNWLDKRRNATLELIEKYELFASIPDLRYKREDYKVNMTASSHVREHLDTLKRGLDFLDKIEQVYFESH